MARGYPKFLFSNPENVKTPGPFIVHLLKPRMICRLVDNRVEDIRLLKNYSKGINGWCLEFLECFDSGVTDISVSDAMDRMIIWASKQNEIDLIYKPDVTLLEENKFLLLDKLEKLKFSKQIDSAGNFSEGQWMFYKRIGLAKYLVFNCPFGKTVDCWIGQFKTDEAILKGRTIKRTLVKERFFLSDLPLVSEYI